MGKGTDHEELTTTGEVGEPTSERIPPAEVLDLDYVYDALAHPRRRYLCYTLLEDTEWSLTDLATKVAAWETDIPEEAVDDHLRERVYVSLYHAQVPKLAEQGVVEFDEARETISAGANANSVLTALRSVSTVLDASQEDHARGNTNDEEP
ncbi:hypothetical protein ACFPYI_09915 [Halomarina salina]|uniref:DUF7344 domain-containing protein n=1 Tax=Halomarina salina TaxID=1872699 RepID=A0ABD5RM87_9EURY|nr:hypothetical protein [Halomarina salina]